MQFCRLNIGQMLHYASCGLILEFFRYLFYNSPTYSSVHLFIGTVPAANNLQNLGPFYDANLEKLRPIFVQYFLRYNTGQITYLTLHNNSFGMKEGS